METTIKEITMRFGQLILVSLREANGVILFLGWSAPFPNKL